MDESVYTIDDVIPLSDLQNYEGEVIVISADAMSCPTPARQLVYATGGFGCSPLAQGSTVDTLCLANGATARWAREDILGIANPSKMQFDNTAQRSLFEQVRGTAQMAAAIELIKKIQ